MADAAGALGGGAAAAEIGGFVGVVTGGVGAGIIVGAGAIIGGAAASVAYANNRSVPPNHGDKGNEYYEHIFNAENKSNKMNYVGTSHNKIMMDYASGHANFDIKGFYDFATENEDEYTIKENALDLNTFSSLISEITELDTEEQHIDYIIRHLPSSVNQQVFREELSSLLSGSNLSMESIKVFETNFWKNNELSETDSIIMNSFFATMRYSYIYWSY